MMRKLFKLSVVALPVTLATPQAANAIELVNHEAVYRLTLIKTEKDRAVVQANGAMGYRFRRKCSTWQTQTEFMFNMEQDNGDTVRIHRMLRFEENMRGQRTDFVGWTNTNKSGKINYRGTVRMPVSDEPGEVSLVKPRKDQIKLAKGVMLPTQAFIKVMDDLMAGETPAPVHFFDPHAKYTEMRLLGGSPIILVKPPEGATQLVEGKTWRLRVTPIYESEERNLWDEHTVIQVHASGVASHMTIDLGGTEKDGRTIISADLVNVREVPSLGCAPAPEKKKRTDTFIMEVPAEGEEGAPTEGMTDAAASTDAAGEDAAEQPVDDGSSGQPADAGSPEQPEDASSQQPAAETSTEAPLKPVEANNTSES